MRNAVVLIACAALCASSESRAAITSYDIFYSAFYTQSTVAPPTSPDVHVFATRVLTSSAADIAAASLTVPNFPFAYNLFAVAPTTYLAARSFGSQAAMELAFPTGLYTHSIRGGTLGSTSATLSRPVSLFFCSEIPAFDADSLNTLAAFPANQGVSLSFASFTRPSAANTALTALTIFDSQNAIVFNAIEPGETTTSITVPANTLQPGTTYRATLYYSSRIETPNAGFGTAIAIVGCDRATNATLVTRIACDGDLNSDGFVDDSDFVVFAPAYDILDCADPGMPAGCPADLNFDGVVDDLDFVVFAAAYNELICP